MEKAYGTTHPNTAASQSALAGCLQVSGAKANSPALVLLRKNLLSSFTHAHALRARLTCAGPSSWLSQAQGRHGEAETLFLAARNVCTSQLGPENPASLTVTANLAACLEAQGRYAEALAYYEAEMEVCRHLLRAAALHRLGHVDDSELTPYVPPGRPLSGCTERLIRRWRQAWSG